MFCGKHLYMTEGVSDFVWDWEAVLVGFLHGSMTKTEADVFLSFGFIEGVLQNKIVVSPPLELCV